MATTIEAFGLERLSPTERVLLAEALWDSVAGEPAAKLLNDAHLADLRLRLEEYRNDPLAGSPLEEVKARLLSGIT